MDDSRSYFKLGLFALLVSAMFAGALIALGAHLFTHVETVAVETAINESVAGLEVGSAVKYRGVTIGQVSRVSFADEKYAALSQQATREPQSILVEMALDPQKFKPLTVAQLRQLLGGMVARGLRAQLSQSLLSGVTVVEIDYVDPKLYPPPKLSWTSNELFIPSAPSPRAQVLGGLEKLVAEINASDIPGIIRHVNVLVSDVDKSVLDLQLANVRAKAVALLDEIRELLSSQSENIRAIVINIRNLTEDGRSAMEDFKRNPSRLILGSPPPHNDPGGNR